MLQKIRALYVVVRGGATFELNGVRSFRIPSVGKVEVDQTSGGEPAHGN